MSEIIASVYDCMRTTGKTQGILFLDEINCVSETLAPTMLQFLQCKTFGNQAVPGGWIIVAAGNPPEYNKSVREFDLVTLDRVRRIDIEPKLSVWQDYARAHRLHPAVTAYLELRPQHFYKIENDVDGVQFVTARGWEDLSAYLQAADRLALPVDEGVIGQYLRHPEVARDFAAYWVLYRKYHEDYGVEDILQGKPYDAVIARAMDASFDERISLVSLLLAGLNTRFADARATGAVTDACYQQLRSFKRTLSQQPDADPADLFAERCDAYRAKLEARMNEVLSNTQLDPARILTEAAIFADKVAVDEETVRLRSHIGQLREMLDKGGATGRKLDFLIQEFNREANTGLNYELDAIAACVIGGVSFVGGIGKIRGIVIGVVMLRLIFVGLTMVGVPQDLQYLIKGAIILFACALDMRKYLVKK